MAPAQSGLDGLLALAVDRSLESRQRLAEEIGDICEEGNQTLTEQERDLVFEILKKLLYDFEIPLRAQLSERLARSDGIPRELIVTLANDEIEVARPVLMHSSILRDPDLIEIIRHRGQQHQIAIARRAQISETLSDALVETEDEDVIRTLLQNPDAEIAEATMAYLVEQSRRVDSFQEPLVNRKDLPQDLAKKLYWWVAAALRQEILQRFDIPPSELDDAMEQSVNQLEGEDATENKVSSAEELARQLADQNAITIDLLTKVLRRGEVPLFEALFAELSGIEHKQTRRIIYD